MKKLSIEKLGQLSIDYREHILCSDVVEVSVNGVWIVNSFGERDFISRSQLRLMSEFLSKCF